MNWWWLNWRWLVISGRVVGEDCLREVGLVDEDYLMKVEVVAEGCLLNNPTRFSTYHQLAFDY